MEESQKLLKQSQAFVVQLFVIIDEIMQVMGLPDKVQKVRLPELLRKLA